MESILVFFFFNDTATTEIYTLSLHDALPICHPISQRSRPRLREHRGRARGAGGDMTSGPSSSHRFSELWGRRHRQEELRPDRKSTRLNSSHANISYAVFCLKKKKMKHSIIPY